MGFMRNFRLSGYSTFSFVLLFLFCFSCGPATEEQGSAVPGETEETIEPDEPAGEPYAVIETGKGDITVKLLPEAAPESVANFIELAEVGFYNRSSFHRVMKGMMIQGGDPLSKDNNPYNDGQGFGSRSLPQEFGDIEFDRGTVAMGRTPGGDDGGSCQFFIVLKRVPDWDGQYNVFGDVVEGIEVAEQISEVSLSRDNHPSMKNRPAGRQVIEKIRIEYRQGPENGN